MAAVPQVSATNFLPLQSSKTIGFTPEFQYLFFDLVSLDIIKLEEMELNSGFVTSGEKPTIMVTNDDGIDAPGLRSLVRVLLATKLYVVHVCAPDSYVILPHIQLISLIRRLISLEALFLMLSFQFNLLP